MSQKFLGTRSLIKIGDKELILDAIRISYGSRVSKPTQEVESRSGFFSNLVLTSSLALTSNINYEDEDYDEDEENIYQDCND